MTKALFYNRLHEKRFEIFFSSQLALLFGSLVVPLSFFETYAQPVLFLFNLAAGILLISKKRLITRFFLILFTLLLLVFGGNLIGLPEVIDYPDYIRLVIYSSFYTIVTLHIISQVWKAKTVGPKVIFGLMSGYISIGLLGFFIFLSIEIISPHSYGGLIMETQDMAARSEALLYYSYITLLTIGYGEIYPLGFVAQKAAILVGLMGQFYLVIITAVVVEKYIRHRTKQ